MMKNNQLTILYIHPILNSKVYIFDGLSVNKTTTENGIIKKQLNFHSLPLKIMICNKDNKLTHFAFIKKIKKEIKLKKVLNDFTINDKNLFEEYIHTVNNLLIENSKTTLYLLNEKTNLPYFENIKIKKKDIIGINNGFFFTKGKTNSTYVLKKLDNFLHTEFVSPFNGLFLKLDNSILTAVNRTENIYNPLNGVLFNIQKTKTFTIFHFYDENFISSSERPRFIRSNTYDIGFNVSRDDPHFYRDLDSKPLIYKMTVKTEDLFTINKSCSIKGDIICSLNKNSDIVFEFNKKINMNKRNIPEFKFKYNKYFELI